MDLANGIYQDDLAFQPSGHIRFTFHESKLNNGSFGIALLQHFRFAGESLPFVHSATSRLADIRSHRR